MMNQQDAVADEAGEVELSPEEREAQESSEARRQAKLDAFGSALAKKRQMAVQARQQSGIEQEWLQDEEFYEGVDDANRHEQVGITQKPVSQVGAASVVDVVRTTGSTLFLNISRTYVEFSGGRAADMLLPTDELAWSISSTPMPDIIDAMNDAQAQQQMVPGTQTPLAQAAKKMVEDIRARAKKAEQRIQDWHKEGQYNAEMRKVIKDAAKVGVGILKGPIPVKRVARAIQKDPATGTWKMNVKKETKPVSKRVDYWKLYPDPACGENIHNGSFIWECDDITARQIRDLKGTMDPDGNPMYIETAIDAILTEGPQKRYDGDRNYHAPDTEQFQIWYFYGVATADDLSAAGVTDVELTDVVPVFVTMINDRVIKAERATLDSGDFPYDVMPWQPRAGHWAGISVTRQVRTPQRIINAATRNMMDNAGIAAGPQIVYVDGVLEPLDGNYKIAPRKFWKMNKDSDIDDVRKAFAAIEFPIYQNELLAIIQFAMKMAEDVTGMPMLMQGQQGKGSETVGGMQILVNNSNTPMRTIAKQFDDFITCPHLQRYYEWLLMYGPAEDEKGDFQVVAHGSSALFERDAQNQAIMAMAPFVKDPDFKIDPAKWIKEWLKAQRLTAENFQYTDDEWQAKQEQMSQSPPQDPRIEAAKIAAETRIKTEEIKAQVTTERTRVDTDRDTAYLQAENERTQLEHEARLRELDQKERIAMLNYATQKAITLEQAKADLAKVAMQLRAQKELAGMGDDAKGPQVTTPPTEPPGRADDGQAYQE